MKRSTVVLALSQLLAIANGQSACPSPSGDIRPSVASGYSLQVVATGLSEPRGLAIDNEGHLLVLEQGSGTVSSHVISEANGCVTAGESSVVVAEGLSLNHGIWINGTTLYASNANSVYSWAYDPAARLVNNQEELITNMNNSGHTTRTLLLSQQVPGMMVVSRGSGGNLDPASTTIEGGTAQVKAFNLNNRTDVYDWNNDGLLMAWGVRNEVGLVEHPVTGGIWGVENSADQISRDGVDVSNNNPGEELNFFGYLNGTEYADQGANFGYPYCLSVWNTSELPNSQSLSIGDQFAFDSLSALNNENRTDEYCASTASPRLVFQAHMAPLDIKFNNSGTEAYVTFHGSWDRDQGVGYKLSLVQFENGQPADASDSLTAATDIVANEDNSVCPDSCFRPAAMAFDSQGRIFMSSDASGEIYLVRRDPSSNGTGTSTSASPSASASSTSSSSSTGICYGPPSARVGAILAIVWFLLS